MDCSRFADEMSAHAAGGEPTPALRAHLAACDRCRADVARRRRGLAGFDRDLDAALRVEPSPEFLPRVRSRVAAAPAASGWMSAWRAVAAASLAVAVLALGLSLLHGPAAPPSERPMVRRSEPSDARTSPPAVTDGVAQRRVAPGVVPHGERAARATEATTPADSSGAVRPEPVVSPAATKRVAARDVAARARVAARSTEPEVLVPASQRLAIRELMQMLRAGILDDKILAEPKDNTHSDISVTPIVVEQIVVPPIPIKSAFERRP